MAKREQDFDRLQAVIEQLDELVGRLEEASSAEVEMSLLERATELADEAGRLLEQVAEG